MIIKSYEIQCDFCGCADHFFHTKQAAIRDYKKDGGIVKNKKHYCHPMCEKLEREKMSEKTREYPCPQCDTGELHDLGGMFIAQVRCTNPECDYEWDDCYSDLITTE